MKRNKFIAKGLAGCLAVGSIIGNSGCSLMERDYFLDEYGQRHYIDTTNQRLGEDFGGLLMMTGYGLTAGLALKNMSRTLRQEQVAGAQQGYLKRRLAEEQRKNQMQNHYTHQEPYFSTPQGQNTFRYVKQQPYGFVPYINEQEPRKTPTPPRPTTQIENYTDSVRLSPIISSNPKD